MALPTRLFVLENDRGGLFADLTVAALMDSDGPSVVGEYKLVRTLVARRKVEFNDQATPKRAPRTRAKA